MRVVIDMQGAQTESRFRGIGRYTMSFAKAVCSKRCDHSIILLLNGSFPETIDDIRSEFLNILPAENIKVWFGPSNVKGCESENELNRNVSQVIREAYIDSLSPDVVHLTSLFEGYVDDAVTSIKAAFKNQRTTVALYDLIPLLNPEHYLENDPWYEKYYRQKLAYLKDADLLFGISEHSCKEGVEFLGIGTKKIVNVSTAVEDKFRIFDSDPSRKRRLFNKFSISKPFLLYTGGADERKNLMSLIRAYSNLSHKLRDMHQLVFAGKMPSGEIQDTAHSLGLSDVEFKVLGYVNDHDLVELYNSCKVFVFPSWHEGFGLPCLEAMSCGAAVIGSNTTSLPEVIGRDDALFDPHDENSISRSIEKCLVDEDFRKELIAHGLVQSKLFSWDKTAEIAIAQWEKICNAQTNDPVDSKKDWVPYDLLSDILQNINDSYLILLANKLAKNPIEKTTRKLLLDISELVNRDAKTGIQRVVRSIIRYLLKNPPVGYSVELIYGSNDGLGYRYAARYGSTHFNVNSIDDKSDPPIDYRSGDIFLGIDFEPAVVISNKKYYDDMRLCGVKVGFVIYDLLPIQMPNFFHDGMENTFFRWLDVIVENNFAVCISQSVSKSFKNWALENNKSKKIDVRWFHLGSDIEASIPSKGFLENSNFVLESISQKISLLMVGTLEPRKGHQQVLDALNILWADGYDLNLVIVGKEGWSVTELVESIKMHPEIDKRLYWLNRISDEYLHEIYIKSTCLIAASYGEGFGLPLVEAANNGIPIIARDIEIFREVAEENAFYFTADTGEALADSILKWVDLYKNNKHPDSSHLKRYTWSESASELCSAIISN